MNVGRAEGCDRGRLVVPTPHRRDHQRARRRFWAIWSVQAPPGRKSEGAKKTSSAGSLCAMALCHQALSEGVHSADVGINILARQRDPGPDFG